MSILVMSQVWKYGPDDRSELLVLLALADHADDNGYCFPSVIGIAEKARMTDRAARKIIRRLEEGGYVRTTINGGRGGKNNYRLYPTGNPEQETGNTVPPEQNDPKPGTVVPKTRNGGSAEPSLNINNHHARAREFSSWSDFVAEGIRLAKPGIAAHVSPTLARELVRAGTVTEEQCRKAGVL